MFYYKYDPNSYIILCKYSEGTNGENIARCDQYFDLLLFDVVIGFLSNDGEILRYTKKLRNVEVVESLLNRIKEQEEVIGAKQEQIDKMQDAIDFIIMS